MAYLGEQIPKLGFGLMRLPQQGKEIDIEQTKRMTDLFIEKGFTYFDTAYGYNNGQSEMAAKAALVDRYPRESFQLATKLPAWSAGSAEEARAMLETSLERTGAGYFDFYLLHNLGDNRTKIFEDYGLWEFLAEQKKKGTIRHMGFSFHDKAAALDDILTRHPEAEFVQLQINYGDWDSPSVESRKCYETARRHGKPVIIMEPVKGGTLASLPEHVASIFRKADPSASLASWAIRFAASLEGLVTVLSGMSSMEQMRDNISFMESFRPLDEKERETIEEVRRALAAIPSVPCTSCGYCLENCPQKIETPDIFSAMNIYLTYDNLRGARGSYAFATRDGGKASQCIECGRCESVCPQQIHIIEELRKAVELLEKKKA